MYRRAAPWVGNHADVRPITENTEDGKERRVWSTLVMEEGIFWYVVEGGINYNL